MYKTIESTGQDREIIALRAERDLIVDVAEMACHTGLALFVLTVGNYGTLEDATQVVLFRNMAAHYDSSAPWTGTLRLVKGQFVKGIFYWTSSGAKLELKTHEVPA